MIFFHAQDMIELSKCGKLYTAVDSEQNVVLVIKVERAGRYLSPFKHCTNYPTYMEKLEQTLVMTTVVFYMVHTISTQ